MLQRLSVLELGVAKYCFVKNPSLCQKNSSANITRASSVMASHSMQNYKPIFREDLLKDKVAFITGGGSGIGFTIAEIFMRHGCHTAIASRDESKLKQAAETLRRLTGNKCLTIGMDVRKPTEIVQAIDKTISEFGRIDILVNNAAGNFICPLSSMSYNAFKTVLDIDTIGTFNVSKTLYDKYMKNHGGVILNISATLHYNGRIFQAHAGSAKAAIDALTKHMAAEWGLDKIRVIGIAPGPIADTVGYKKLAEDVGVDIDDLISTIPLQRLGTRQDVAESALFLSSNAASYITGHTLVVDGGSWLIPNSDYPRFRNSKL